MAFNPVTGTSTGGSKNMGKSPSKGGKNKTATDGATKEKKVKGTKKSKNC